MAGVDAMRTQAALEKIAAAPVKMYLGGSRRMDELHHSQSKYRINITPATDYDYYATHSEQIASYLADNGFHLSKLGQDPDDECNPYGLDDEAIAIYYMGQVQVVLRKDAEFYKRVFDSIPIATYYHYLWKSSPLFYGEKDAILPMFNALFAVGHAFEGTTKPEPLTPVVRDPIKAYEAAMKGIC